MTRSVFYGFGAFVGSVTGPTTCGWWPEDPAKLGWDPAKQIQTDLARTPEAARRGEIEVADIRVDDHTSEGLGSPTSVGPMWPGGSMTGSIWLEASYWSALGERKPARTPSGLSTHPYELCSVLYWDGPLAGRRFYGYHAEIQATKDNLALVAIYAPGTSRDPDARPLGRWWLDLAQHAHPVEPGFTAIGIDPELPKVGALFFDARTASALLWPQSKYPQWLGGAVARRARGRRSRGRGGREG